MDTVLTVCRLARSKSSALGAENRRFKSFHTDQRYEYGKLAERLIAPDLKSVMSCEPGRRGSNPLLSATSIYGRLPELDDWRCLLNRRSQSCGTSVRIAHLPPPTKPKDDSETYPDHDNSGNIIHRVRRMRRYGRGGLNGCARIPQLLVRRGLRISFWRRGTGQR